MYPLEIRTSTDVPPVDTDIIRKALVAGGFLNVARRIPAPKEFAMPEYQTVIGNHKVMGQACAGVPFDGVLTTFSRHTWCNAGDDSPQLCPVSAEGRLGSRV